MLVFVYVEYVDQFTYLDIIFSHAGNMSLAVNVLQEQALHAYYNRLSLFERVHLDIKTKLSLFDKNGYPDHTLWGGSMGCLQY